MGWQLKGTQGTSSIFASGDRPLTSEPLRYLDGRITIDPDLCNGRPTIRGLRITVETVIGFLAAGDSKDEILDQYPSLEPADIEACLRFAADMMAHRYTIQRVA
ncbi:MAG: DUF433 domain-containing protein [Thiohalocapsa sp. PB-PSB1]|mgnify:CR=1 FL=1|jgi:uncharacterized protein (DUF433 family)|nr:MAG: DUF433 domain-containing protein [Thiohalocapsa sp. PB-PSB1]